jgi:hypothetical protein
LLLPKDSQSATIFYPQSFTNIVRMFEATEAVSISRKIPSSMALTNLRYLWSFVTFSIFTAIGNLAIACPNCKESITAGGASNAQNLARGFELSIYLMLGMPVLIFSSLAGLFYLQLRRAAKNPEMWLRAEGVQIGVNVSKKLG